jgi:hypothetical protein
MVSPATVRGANTRVRHYTGNGRIATPCYRSGDQVGVVFDLPPDQYPLRITEVGISWANRFAHAGFSVEQGIHVYGGAIPSSMPIFTQPYPVLTTDSLNTFDIADDDVQIQSGPFVVSLEYLNDAVPYTFATTITHDGNGCTAGKNLVYTPAGGWQDACATGVNGDWVFHVEYEPVNCVAATGSDTTIFSGAEVSQTACEDLWVTNDGCDTLTISSIAATGASVFAIDTTATPHTVLPGDTVRIAACVTPVNTNPVTGTVTVVSNAWNSPTVMTLVCQPNCVTAKGPEPTSFDGIEISQTACTELAVANEGCDTLYITSINATGAASFVIDTTITARSIAPGGTARIAVCVTPNGPEVATCSIHVVSNAWNSPTVMNLSCLPSNTSTGVGAPNAAFAITGVVPNPFNPDAAIHFTLPAAGSIDADVYAVDGARVRTLAHDVTFGAGENQLRWNGRTDRGEPAASGVYLVRIRAGSETRVSRMVLLK